MIKLNIFQIRNFKWLVCNLSLCHFIDRFRHLSSKPLEGHFHTIQTDTMTKLNETKKNILHKQAEHADYMKHNDINGKVKGNLRDFRQILLAFSKVGKSLNFLV